MSPLRELHAVLASPARRTLLELLRGRVEPQGAADLAEATGLHVTTVRHHLEGLQQAGLVVGGFESRGGVGRPRRVFTAASRHPMRSGPCGTTDSYALLSRLLAPRLGSSAEVRVKRAQRAGQDWATALAPAPLPDGGTVRQRRELAVKHIAALFTEIGFDPEVVVQGAETELRLRACPFIDVAREFPDVVCAVHLGLLRGTLQALRSPRTTARLQPFATPEVCVATISPSASAA